MSDDVWTGVRERVLRLAEQPGADEIFGARGHGFRLGSVMSEEQLQALESDLRSELPAPYRYFLLQVGRGAPVPATA
ncbi:MULTISPECIES: SMI1/KNR4 family protein [Streptomyces]|uniref:SMI1/KNR4 family protein n=1 Tax=Streptomyces TaxID=1883 RepID=UPI000A4EC497|nr:SMI1/KNR4 family protein [Streptomyces virginiae]